MQIRAEIPDKLAFLFQPKRYKVAYGGRGSAKSWSFARALLVLGANKPMRILCAREVQKSIKDSVHKLLQDQIEMLGLSSFYYITDTAIKGRNGTEFAFSGLSSHTVTSIKSFEGIDIAWVEEAQTVSKKSWNILTPTIRAPGSEIWVTFNPDLDTDETYQRFVVRPPSDCIVEHVNYYDNPWFTAVLEQERLDCQRQNPADYENIWEGKCKTAVEGAIYGAEVVALEMSGRICPAPYDSRLKVHTVWDFGWNDSMAIILAQRRGSEVRIIEYIEDSHRKLSDYVADLKDKRYNWGYDWIPHDGFSKDFKTGKSAEEIMTSLGREVKPVPQESIETGIKAARETFHQCYFDRDNTVRLRECLKRYRRQINRTTNEAGGPLHDEYSHGADVFRYMALSVDQFTNEEWGGSIKYRSLSTA